MESPFEWPATRLVQYKRLYQASVERREEYWGLQAEKLSWHQPWSSVLDEDMHGARFAWFGGGTISAHANAVGRHSGEGRNALVYLDKALTARSMGYRELDEIVRDYAARLHGAGLVGGQRLVCYLPNTPEAVFLALATAFLGVTFVPVPARFTAERVVEIAGNCGAAALVVQAEYHLSDYLRRVDQLGQMLPAEVQALCVGGHRRPFKALERIRKEHTEPAALPAEHPLAILYAGSATGIPRGSVLAAAGTLVQSGAFGRMLFRLPGERRSALYCAVDLASAAGYCHGLWGTLLNGDTLVLAATRTRPVPERLRAVTSVGPACAVLTSPDRLEEWLRNDGAELPPFKIVASCQDLLTPRLCERAAALAASPERVLNLWIQNETGCAVIATLPHGELNRPGALGLPLPGIQAKVVDDAGRPRAANKAGRLVFAGTWPSLARSIWGQPERFRNLFFSAFEGHYSTSDAVRVDRDGFFWFMARRDDNIKVRGISLRTDEMESVLRGHPLVEDAAVVGAVQPDGATYPVAFLVPSGAGQMGPETLVEELKKLLERQLGPLAVPKRMVVCSRLPRSGSGKLARRLLRVLASGQKEDLPAGSLEDPSVVDELLSAMEIEP